MNPTIINKPAFLIVGARALWNLTPEVPGILWQSKVLPRRKEIKAAPGAENSAFGVFNPVPGSGGKLFDYVAGMMVTSFEDIPIGMVGWEIPNGNYASVTAIGLNAVSKVYNEVIESWLPSSGYTRVDGPAYCISSHINNPSSPSAFWQVNIRVNNPKQKSLAEMWPAG